MHAIPGPRRVHAPHIATLIGAMAVVLWSPMLGMLRSIAEIFGTTGGAALVFSAAALFSGLMLGVPRPSAFRRRYLLVGDALFVGCEISISMAIGLAHDRGEALELVMINYLWPCLTIMLAVLTRQQKAHWLLAPASALCIVGIALVVTGDGGWSPRAFSSNLVGNPTAYGLALTAACMWASYSLVTRRIGGSRNGVPLFMAATAVVLWIKYLAGDEPRLPLHWGGLAQVASFGLLTAGAYACWNHGLQHGHITSMAIASYFAPILSVLWGCLWLSIVPGEGFYAGMMLVVAGSLLCFRATFASSNSVLPPDESPSPIAEAAAAGSPVAS